MSTPYRAPGVSITEKSTPIVSPIFGRPTSIALVGEAAGSNTYQETVYLDHNVVVPLSNDGIDQSTIVVADASNPTSAFTLGGDYLVAPVSGSTNGYSLQRRIPTSMGPVENCVAVVTSAKSSLAVNSTLVTLDHGTTGYATGSNGRAALSITASPNTDYIQSLVLQRAGAFTGTGTNGGASDWIVGGSPGAVTIRRSGSTRIQPGQDVFISFNYTSNGLTQQVTDYAVTVPADTSNWTVPNLATADVDLTSGARIVVTNALGYSTTSKVASVFTTNIGNTGDYTLATSSGVLNDTTSTGGSQSNVGGATTTLVLTNASSMPTGGGVVSVYNGTTFVGLLSYTGVTSNTLTGVVGINGTTSISVPNGCIVRLCVPSQKVVQNTGSSNLYTTSNPTGYSNIGSVADGDQVIVTYTATPSSYFYAQRCSSMSEVESNYGTAFDDSGNINSPITLAAYMAFINGAPDLVIQPLFHTATGIKTDFRTTPAAASTATPSSGNQYQTDWATTLSALQDVADINVVVPVYTCPASSAITIFSQIQNYQATVWQRSSGQQFVYAIFGEDTTPTGGATQTSLRAHAQTLAASAYASRCSFVSPGSFQIPSPSAAQLNVGGQYIAAGYAGMLAARSIQIPLTRKPVSGVLGVNDVRSESAKDDDASSGLVVIEQRNGVVRVRHAITLLPRDVLNSETSVVRAKGYIIDTIRESLDTDIIGQIVVDDFAPFVVQSLVQGILEMFKSNGVLVDYTGLSAVVSSGTPTTIEVTFSYRPAFPLNYVNLTFSVDATSGTIQTTGA